MVMPMNQNLSPETDVRVQVLNSFLTTPHRKLEELNIRNVEGGRACHMSCHVRELQCLHGDA